MKSCRRSYHMPCAFEQDCRWDCDNFIMLCPSHKSVKFPSEKSKSRKRASTEASPKPAPITSERLSFWATSSDGPKEWFLCGSALSPEDKLKTFWAMSSLTLKGGKSSEQGPSALASSSMPPASAVPDSSSSAGTQEGLDGDKRWLG